MLPLGKVKELYLASSLTELQEKASITDGNTSNRHAATLSKSALKLYTEAKHCMQVDQEKSYIFFFRCVNVARQMWTLPGGKNIETFDCKMLKSALDHLETLTESLIERYKVKDEKKNLNGLQKCLSMNGEVSLLSEPQEKVKSVELLPASDTTLLQVQNGNSELKREYTREVDEKDGQIDCMELYSLLQDKQTALIIFDCRSSEDFAESHINHPSCVNIPEEVLKPGLTAAALDKVVQGEARSMWSKRALVDFVVLMDDDSSRSNMVPHSALNSLKLAICKWDVNTVLKRDLVILENGFQEWLMHYPTTVTKMPPAPPASVNSLEFQNSLPYIDVEYPDLDEEMPKPADTHLMNTGFHENSPTKASRRSVLQDSEATHTAVPYKENDVELCFTLRPSTTTQIPKYDRSNKPKPSGSSSAPLPQARSAWSREEGEESVQKVLIRQQDLAEEQVAVSEERLHQEQAFQRLRQERETEANQVMLQEVQRKEEQLLGELQKLDDKHKALQEKFRLSEQEKDDLKKRLQVNLEDKQHKNALAEKQDRKKKMDSEVERLRQERKKRERLEKEEKEAAAASEKLKLEKEKQVEPSADSAQQQTVNTHEHRPSPASAPTRPTVKPSSAPPGGGQAKGQQADMYTTRLREESSEGVSPSRSLSRSYSSPNIAQLLAQEGGREASTTAPPFHKLHKQAKLGQEISPSINRALKPAEPGNTRVRNFSPVFSSQRNTMCGLKNLGNTCFMNSVLQCLSHTENLAVYLIRETYLKDINRSVTTRGEVTQELSSVFQNLWRQTYRSISPHEFKSTVSRYMSVCQGYDQQDAHEFLVVLMEKLHLETNKGLPNKGSNPPDLEKMANAEEALNHFWIWHLKIHNSHIVQSLEGVLQSRLTCSVCGHWACTYEVFSCLSLPIPSTSKCSLKDCIQSLLKAETIRGEAAWKCPNCNRKQEAEKKMALCRLPPVLIIHLKRFSYEGLWRRKLVTHVDFPLFDLNMEPYLIVENKKCRYHLYAVVNHYGTLEGGHYTAYCKNEKWYNFDDHDVQLMNPSGVKTSAAYILFYSASDNT